MSDVKYKVYNENKYDYGIVFMDGIRSQNIKPGSFALLTEDDIYYLHSISKTFTKKHLIVKEQHILENLGLASPESKALSDAEIIELLKGNPMKMKKELNKIVEENQKYRVYDIAKTLDLPASKIKFVAEFTGRNVLSEE